MVDYSKGRATLSDRRAVLHQDFVLHILCSSRESSQSQAIAATQPGQPTLSTIAVTIHPGDLFHQNVNVKDFVGEIIFMADRSGSMSSKIPSLINVMNIFLRSLPEACSFNIFSFGSFVTWLWPSSKRYSQETLDVASKHVNSFRANYGGTEIYISLYQVLEKYNKQNDVPTSLILLTDGEVWDEHNVIQLVRNTVEDNSNIRFFSLGIGDRVSHRLVEGIGQQGGGYAEVVPESSMGSWQERAIQMLKAALTPSRLQCNVDLGKDLAMKTSEREIAGYSAIPRVGSGSASHPCAGYVFAFHSLLHDGDRIGLVAKTINITVTTDKGEKLTAQLPIQTAANQSAIQHLAAKALMNDYETGQSWLYSLNPDLKSSNPTGFEEVLKHEAEHLGQRWSIPSRWTSYVAVDRTTAQQHAISLHKVDAVEVRQLTRLRLAPILSCPISAKRVKRFDHRRNRAIDTAESRRDMSRRRATLQDAYPIPDEDNDLAGEAQVSGWAVADSSGVQAREEESSLSNSPDSSDDESHLTTNTSSNDREVRDPEHTPPSDFPALETILRAQQADGKFNFHGRSFISALKEKYDSNALEEFLKSRFNRESQATSSRLAELSYNILTVVYITDEHDTSRALWELQVAKAQQWIKRTIMELLKRSGDAKETPVTSLEELVESILEEMEKRVLQEP
ncbi:hypothetical protein CNMCM5793_000885 [Aspergillus hiratsukae]|uniref:VWFA domain-containing protein n=1 Tax=Aspergillus hiratsukae TaxID=1194566 RepID=A0A8H6PA96_9EURO|nr:hypothetical protein CNMCM5793_000885 [Aspergillus hiratsukae]KAF7162678.1 hypothetical protein CNMCM6106_009497 [Aspergillus hiratsukae]